MILQKRRVGASQQRPAVRLAVDLRRGEEGILLLLAEVRVGQARYSPSRFGGLRPRGRLGSVWGIDTGGVAASTGVICKF